MSKKTKSITFIVLLLWFFALCYTGQQAKENGHIAYLYLFIGLILAGHFLFAVAAERLAEKKGRNKRDWFFLGFALNISALIYLWLAADLNDKEQREKIRNFESFLEKGIPLGTSRDKVMSQLDKQKIGYEEIDEEGKKELIGIFPEIPGGLFVLGEVQMRFIFDENDKLAAVSRFP